VSLEALPPGVELPTAEATLFVGRAVRVLSHPRGDFRGRVLLPESVAADATAALRRLACDGGEFDRAVFETAMEGIRRPVAARLGRLVVGDAQLLRHLEALRHYYLLGRGDFFQSFFEEAAGLLRLPPRPATAEADMVAPFAQAALKSSGADDPLLANFRLRFQSPQQNPDADAVLKVSRRERRVGVGGGGGDNNGSGPRVRIPSYDGWDNLELEYAVPWPLGLVLTKEALRRYNHLFQYLLRLRRTNLALDEAWCRLRRKGAGGTPGSAVRNSVASVASTSRGSPRGGGLGGIGGEGGVNGRGERGGAFEACQRVRHEMAFLVNNWLTYLQVDVVGAQYQTMVERVTAGGDFAEAQRAHRSFLAALTAQSFLDLASVSSIVEAIMQLSSALCAAVAHLPSAGLCTLESS
jgi:gamma-tubulin complex component 4